MSQVNIFSPIFHDLVKWMAPWQCYIGGPGFPEKPLYKTNQEFVSPKKVELNYTNDNQLKSIIVFNDNNDSASIEFELEKSDSEDIKVKGILKKNDIVELIITEYFDNNVIYLTLEHPQKKDYDIEISVKQVNGEKNKYEMKILFYEKTLEGIIDTEQFEVPKIAVDFAEEISKMQSDLTIAALNPAINEILTLEAYKKNHPPVIMMDLPGILNIMAVTAADLINIWLSIPVYIVSEILAAEELR